MKNDYYFISELFIMKFLLSQSKSDKSFFFPKTRLSHTSNYTNA